MRCLYCGKQLPLLKKLTGGGEFCSEAHRQKYQEEYNKLALSRLLQTQNSDADAPNRSELVLNGRLHPALQSGRPALRALEAPKSADSPLLGNWTPGANRTQRALPPATPAPPPGVSEPPSFAKPVMNRPPLPALPPVSAPPPVSKPDSAFRFDQNRNRPDPVKEVKPESFRPEPLAKSNAKRDAFSFRPMEPFPDAKPPSPPPVPLGPPPSAIEEPPVVAPEPPPAPLTAPPPTHAAPPSVLKRPEPVDPPEAPFVLEEVRTQGPPPVPALEAAGVDPFTKGHPPKTEGWARWEPGVQGPPGLLEEPDRLLPLFGPPGTTEQKEELEQERLEIRKKILDNQVKPGDFKQTVPTAPIGPNTVLPICPPAAALDKLVVLVKPKAPADLPVLFVTPPSTGEELWTGWSLSGTAPVRHALTLIAPETQDAAAEQVLAVARPAVAPLPSPAPKPGKGPDTLRAPAVEPPRNYKAAEALKSAAQNVPVESAAKVEARQPDKPSTPRHEVFVDLSVLGIEEDEDADAESLAGEGESPPGRKRRRNSAARKAVSELMVVDHPPAPPAEAKLAQSYQALSFRPVVKQSLRLHSFPLRPKVVFEQANSVKAPSPATIVTSPEAVTSPTKAASSLASAWSAKRLKKIETGAPSAAPGDSGLPKPVETPVSELKPVSSATPPTVETAKISPNRPTVQVSKPVVLGDAQSQSLVSNFPAMGRTKVADKSPEPAKAAPAPKVPLAANLQPKPAEKTVGPSTKTPAGKPPDLRKMTAFTPPVPVDAKAQVDAKAKSKAPQNAVEVPKIALAAPVINAGTAPSLDAKAEPKTADPNGKKEMPEPKKGSHTATKADGKKAEEANKAGKQAMPTPIPLPENPPFEAPLLGAGARENESFWANLPVLPKMLIALSLTGVIGGGAWFVLHPQSKASTIEAPKRALGPAKAGRSLMMNLPGGWSPDWGGDFNRKKNRTISFYRPSANSDDYRMEFEGQVDSKGIGLVYRAADPKNYYAYKVELIRSGADPGAALSRFSVINGDESQKHYSPLAKPMRSGVSFRMRVDVRGDEFSAYINDELIEVWQDDRLRRGGFGVMTELGEVGQIRKLQVFELLP